MEQINPSQLPKHIAIIMDGNGRWAKEKGKERLYGHFHGVESVREIVEGCAELGVSYLTLYAFSTENWDRPVAEVDGLMNLLCETINKETATLNKNNIRLTVIGCVDRLPAHAYEQLQEAIAATSKNTGLTLVMALSYSGRWDILHAVQNIARKVANGDLKVEELGEDVFQQNLSTKEIPDPELMIRTSGEFRISNFLLYQLAYTELVFTPVLWPDFRKQHLYQAIIDFQSRERRFGKTSAQIAPSDSESL
ncbi:isoprenyl transferase [Gynurincola endophyticus]|uniref:isoprenyl transferase n=1 Tax=Gynurincola endophyticus TaxID=2479004 RepID=UPI0021D2E716|nr:isoprenyl transferase [Gynurincola endophyticus]